MADTDKVPKTTQEIDIASINKAVKIIQKGGLAGTIAILAMLGGAVKWLDDRISQTVSEAVRKEVDPLKERLIRLEVKQERQDK